METIFCANDQRETQHELATYADELIATCTECGRTLKFPQAKNRTALTRLFKQHRAANEGQEVIKPGEIGPPDLHVPPGNHEPEPEPPVEQLAEDLTDAEREAWAGINGR